MEGLGVVGLGDMDGVGEEVICGGVVGVWEWCVDLAMESDLLIKKVGVAKCSKCSPQGI